MVNISHRYLANSNDKQQTLHMGDEAQATYVPTYQ